MKKLLLKSVVPLVILSYIFVTFFVQVNAQNIDISLTINEGDFGVDTSLTSCVLNTTVSSSDTNSSCSLNNITVTDARGTGVGWSVAYTIKNFASNTDVISLCTDISCSSPRLSVNWQAQNVTAGNSFGSTDSVGIQQPSSLTGLTTNDTTNSLSLLSFTNASQTYGKSVISNSGSGYTSPPAVEFTGGSCFQNPVATSTITGDQVSAINISTPGLGCTSAPTISFTGGDGSGAAAILISGAGEGQFVKNTVTNGFTMSIPAFIRPGAYSTVISFSIS
jgi:hypothetical protein